MKAHLRNIRITPKKTSIIAELVRGKKANEALNILKFTPKKAAKFLYKVIRSAVANAENNFKQDKNHLIIKSLIVTEGPPLKRGKPASRGRWHPIIKRTSHITVTLEASGEKVESVKQKSEKPRRVSTEEGSKEAIESKKEISKKEVKESKETNENN